MEKSPFGIGREFPNNMKKYRIRTQPTRQHPTGQWITEISMEYWFADNGLPPLEFELSDTGITNGYYYLECAKRWGFFLAEKVTWWERIKNLLKRKP